MTDTELADLAALERARARILGNSHDVERALQFLDRAGLVSPQMKDGFRALLTASDLQIARSEFARVSSLAVSYLIQRSREILEGDPLLSYREALYLVERELEGKSR